MSTGVLLDKKINTYLTQLSISQKKALLTVAETFLADKAVIVNMSKNAYKEEMEIRFFELESGSVKGVSLTALEQKARKSYKKKGAKL